ncbi:hypothetical protein [Nitrospira sp. Kam-Ns4a]
MSGIPSPRVPPYRVTLFYGPDLVGGPPQRLACVFNVKKRSWKGGVQITVEVEERQLDRLRAAVGFDAWLQGVLAGWPEADQDDYVTRARDAFVQAICARKLDLALEAGLSQENGRLPAEALTAELERAILGAPERIMAHVLTELDLADS